MKKAGRVLARKWESERGRRGKREMRWRKEGERERKVSAHTSTPLQVMFVLKHLKFKEIPVVYVRFTGEGQGSKDVRWIVVREMLMVVRVRHAPYVGC